jgi:hypothetical protein
MQALTLSSAAGWRWIPDGYRLFKKNPPVLGLLVFGYWIVTMLLSAVPLIGAIAVSVCMPALSVGVMNGCRGLDAGRPIALPILFSAFRSNAPVLFTLGGLYFALTMLILGVSALIDGGTLFNFMMGKSLNREALDDGSVLLAAQVSLALLVPVMMAYWYAPMLSAWHGLPASKALFFSLVACWRNWRAFMFYGIALFFFCVIVPGAAFILLASLLPQGTQMMVALLAAPLLLVLAPTIFASFYASYRDVFVADRVDVVA